MKNQVAQKGAANITIAVQAPYAELEPLLAKAAGRISESADIEGFRKGKAPYEVVKQRVGEFKILEEAARLYIQKGFLSILEDIEDKEYKAKGKSFEPVGGPEISITKIATGEDLEFKITLALLPAIELPDYRAITKRVLQGKRVPETTEKEVAAALEGLRESRAKLVTVNRGAKLEDRVEIDFSARMGGVPVEGGESEHHPLILGRGRLVPGFEDALVGMKTGEEKEFTLAVPEDYRDRVIAGKSLEFKAHMALVQERDVPEWGDEFAKSLGDFTSAAAAEQSIRDGLAAEKVRKERERLRMALADTVANETKAEIPAALIERELEKMLAELKDSIAGAGLPFDEYLAHIRKTETDLRREWRGDAQRRVKIALALREIAKREGIEPSAQEVQEAARRTALHRGVSNQGLHALDRDAFIRYHTGIARNEKVFQFLENL